MSREDGREGRRFAAGERRIDSAAGCYIIANLEGLRGGSEKRWREAIHFAGSCGADAIQIGSWAGDREAELAIEAGREEGIGVAARAFSGREANALKDAGLAILETTATALKEAIFRAEICRMKTPLIIGASKRELEEIGEVAEAVGKERGNFAVWWTPGDEDRQMNLRTISELRDLFPTRVVGFSAPAGAELHAVGALALGAWMIELSAPAEWESDPKAREGLCEAISDLRRVSRAL